MSPSHEDVSSSKTFRETSIEYDRTPVKSTHVEPTSERVLKRPRQDDKIVKVRSTIFTEIDDRSAEWLRHIASWELRDKEFAATELQLLRDSLELLTERVQQAEEEHQKADELRQKVQEDRAANPPTTPTRGSVVMADPLGGRRQAQGPVIPESPMQVVLRSPTNRNLDEIVSEWENLTDKIIKADNISDATIEMLENEVEGVGSAVEKLEARVIVLREKIGDRSMRIPFSSMTSEYLQRISVRKTMEVIPASDFKGLVKALHKASDPVLPALTGIPNMEFLILRSNLQSQFGGSIPMTEAWSRQIIDSIQHRLISMLGFKERSLVMGMEVILATTGSEACVFKWKNAQGVLHKTSTGGKPDYLNLSWSELAQRRLEGEVKLPVDVGPHQVLGDGGWVEKLDLSRHKRWRDPLLRLKTLDGGGSKAISEGTVISIIEAKCPDKENGAKSLIEHLPQVILQSRVGYERLDGDDESSVPFVLSDGEIWIFGVLVQDPDDDDEQWICCHSEPVPLSLAGAAEPPKSTEGERFREEVTFVLQAMLCWTCVPGYLVRKAMWKLISGPKGPSSSSDGASAAQEAQ